MMESSLRDFVSSLCSVEHLPLLSLLVIGLCFVFFCGQFAMSTMHKVHEGYMCSGAKDAQRS